MPKAINVVYSHLPDDRAGETDFNRWYDEHLFTALSIDGFASIQPFRLLPVITNSDAPLPYRYLALAELDRDADEAMAIFEHASASLPASHVELDDSDSGVARPSWWDDVRFASWNGVALGERVESAITTSSEDGSHDLYIVFSQPPTGPGEEDEFNVWYDEHLHEIFEIPGFVAAQRFRLMPAVENPATPSPYRYAVLWEVNRDPDTINAAMVSFGLDSRDSYADLKETGGGGPALPDWWDRVRFASWNAVALRERVYTDAQGVRS